MTNSPHTKIKRIIDTLNSSTYVPNVVKNNITNFLLGLKHIKETELAQTTVLNELVSIIPSPLDNKATVLFKLMAIFKLISSFKDRCYNIETMYAHLNVSRIKGGGFLTNILQDQHILRNFTCSSRPLPTGSYITECISKRYGGIVLINECRLVDGSRCIYGVFISDKFNLRLLRDDYWELHNNNLELISVNNGVGIKGFSYKPNSIYNQNHVLQYKAIWDNLNNRTKTIMLYGLPGNGKTTSVIEFALRYNLKAIKIGSVVLQNGINFDHLEHQIHLLNPDIIILDDFDRFKSMGNDDLTLRTLELLRDDKKRLVFITANETKNFNKAVLRSQRVDECIQFFNPTNTEKTQILEKSPKKLPPYIKTLLLERTVDWNFADFDSVLESILLLPKINKTEVGKIIRTKLSLINLSKQSLL